MASNVSSAKIDTIIALRQPRGFVFQAGEIYGGSRSAWDYGPLGAELKENIKRQWWQSLVRGRDDVVGLDSSVILPRQVWEASGHVDVFSDPLVECPSATSATARTTSRRSTRRRRAVRRERPHGHRLRQLRHPRPVDGAARILRPAQDLPRPRRARGLHYLRPETAQGIFVNFPNVLTASRKKPPFGIGQIGKSFRNEITPGNFIFRTREFEQMEMEFFVEPGTDEQWHEYWMEERMPGTPAWASAREPALFRAPAGEAQPLLQGHHGHRIPLRLPGQEWGELEGIANRTDFDLRPTRGPRART